MFYLLVYLACGLLYSLFLASVDPQYMIDSIRWQMAVVLFSLATMASAARYVENMFLKTPRKDDYLHMCFTCKHCLKLQTEEPCSRCSDDYNFPHWEEPEDDLQ